MRGPGCSGTMKLGSEGVRRAVRTLPSAFSIRTSTSVSVPSSRSIAIRWPSSPRVQLTAVLDESTARLHRSRLVHGVAEVRQSRLYAEPEGPERRNLPGHQEDIRSDRAQLQKAWPHLVCVWAVQRQQQHRQQTEEHESRFSRRCGLGHCTVTRSGGLVGDGRE